MASLSYYYYYYYYYYIPLLETNISIQLLKLSLRLSSFVSIRLVVDVCSDVSEELTGFIFRLASSGLRGCCSGWKHERVGCIRKLEKIWLIRTVEG